MRSRRIGVGFTGLGDMLAMLQIRYDTPEAVETVDRLFQKIKWIVYDESANLALEKGSFPAFDPEQHFRSPFFEDFPEELVEKLRVAGLRNGALLTVPPVGSGSVLAGTSSGIEPIFALYYIRRSESLSKETFKVYHPLVRTYMEQFEVNEEHLPSFFVTAHEIDPEFRVRMQATIQKHIDHSISSTVNLPRETPVEEVDRIYRLAWKLGCKGITIYREGSREGILITQSSKTGEENKDEKEKAPAQTGENRTTLTVSLRDRRLVPRPRKGVLTGHTYKLRTDMGNVYVTVNEDEEGPVEVFIHLGKSGSTLMAFAEAIGRLVSLALRSGVSPHAVIEQLEGIKSGTPVRQPDGLVVFSVPDALAKALRMHLEGIEPGAHPPATPPIFSLHGKDSKLLEGTIHGDLCPECGASMVMQNGCATCMECGYSKCT